MARYKGKDQILITYNSINNRIFVVILAAIFCISMSTSIVFADESVSVNGAYLGFLNILNQENQTSTDSSRRQFDFAGNIDFGFKLREGVTGTMQLQTGTGGGSIGFQGPQVVVTDLNILWTLKNEFALTIGSFDTPFGFETLNLTNNADMSSNNLMMNNLMYSALGGPVGTLNTLGIRVDHETQWTKIMTAVTNGTDESAANFDGNFGYVTTVGYNALPDMIFTSFAYMNSKDRDKSGVTGLNAAFQGWLGELFLGPYRDVSFTGNIGGLEFDDDSSSTKDIVTVWSVEGKYEYLPYEIAFRVSAWMPEDANGDNTGISTVLPNPGFGITANGQPVPADQDVIRFQIGGAYSFNDNLKLRAEWILDNYDNNDALTKGHNVNGILLGLTGIF
ncbi:MAG: porin [Candidatus Electryonea clarkiae]|nr:porin [Candidatus Electryonea clarkiae]MDP8287338.1 porin [Candidatus Electryonea clarkiae]